VRLAALLRNRRARYLGSLLLAGCAAASFAWAVLGDLSETTTDDPQYILHGPESSRGAELLVAAASFALVAVAAVLCSRATRHTRSRRAGFAQLAVAVMLGASVGGGVRVLTAGTDGANIGGGLYLLFGIPATCMIGGLLLWRALVLGRGLEGARGSTAS
jgi:hypothetical protein